MGVLNLLESVELISSSPVLPNATPEGTLTIQVEQANSLGSSSPLDNNQEEYNFGAEDIPLTTVCKCGYRRPFCACGFYKFPG